MTGKRNPVATAGLPVRSGITRIVKRVGLAGAVVAALVAAGVGGYLLGWKSFRPGAPGPGPAAAGAGPARHAGGGGGGPAGAVRREATATDTVARALESLRFADHDLGFEQAVHLFNRAGVRAGGFADLLDEVAALPDSRSREQLVEALALCWANDDPAAAFGAMRDQLPPKAFLANLHTLVRLWAADDPSAAYAAYRDDVRPLLEGRPHTGAEFTLSMVFGRLAREDFQAALAEVQNIAGEEEAKYALRGVAGAAMAHADDPEFLLPLLDLPDADQATVFSQIASDMARSGDPRRALEWIEGLPVTGEVGSDAVNDIARAWAWEAPTDAAAWAAAHDNPDHLATVIGQWADWEPNAAGEWLGGLDATANPTLAANAYGRFAVTVVQEDPESALAWTAAIADPEVRTQTVKHLARLFRHTVVDDPRSVIAASGLTDDEKTVLAGAAR